MSLTLRKVSRDSIIDANPQISYRNIKIRGRSALAFTDADGSEVWVIWNDYGHAMGRAPWNRGQMAALLNNLKTITPGVEFNSAAGDHYAKIMRKNGFVVDRLPGGSPRVS